MCGVCVGWGIGGTDFRDQESSRWRRGISLLTCYSFEIQRGGILLVHTYVSVHVDMCVCILCMGMWYDCWILSLQALCSHTPALVGFRTSK